MKETYKAAVIGCGRIGMLLADDSKRPKPATHAGAYASHPRLELAALVDPDPAKEKEAARLYPKAKFFRDAEEMLKEVKPDVISIAAFHSVHHPMVLLAAKHKVPVIVCEKPIADTLEAGQEMIEACRASGSKLIINHIRRFDPFLNEWAKKIREGVVGEVQQASTLYAIGLYHMGTHLVDLIRLYLGDIEWVAAWQNRRAHTVVPGDWCVDGILGMESGARVALQSLNVKDFSTLELRIIGTKGEVFVRDLGRVVDYTPISESREYGGFHELHVAAQERFHAKDQVFFKGMANHVVDVLDGKVEPASTGEDSLEALKVLAALKESGEHDGRKVAIT
jgi:predicted dehydrogenase